MLKACLQRLDGNILDSRRVVYEIQSLGYGHGDISGRRKAHCDQSKAAADVDEVSRAPAMNVPAAVQHI